jgi:AcrR family transcriptional regulator
MKPQRLRRSREDARAEILEAAHAALGTLDFAALTVDEVMARTGMTRSAFYHYFTGLDELVVGLLERFEHDVRDSVDPWLKGEIEGEEPTEATRKHLAAMFEVLLAHRASYSAVVQASGGYPRVYQEWQTRILGYFIDLTERFIRRQVSLGLSRVEDPRGIARALILMNNAVLNDNLVRPEAHGALGDARAVASIWNATIYGRPD